MKLYTIIENNTNNYLLCYKIVIVAQVSPYPTKTAVMPNECMIITIHNINYYINTYKHIQMTSIM